jgi:hypothetical protein
MSLLLFPTWMHASRGANVVAFTSPLAPAYVQDVLNPVMARVCHLPITFCQLRNDRDHKPQHIIVRECGSLRDVHPMSTDLWGVLLSAFPSLLAAYTFIPLPLAPAPPLRTWDDAKCVREAFPEVHTVIFVPSTSTPLAKGGKPLERRQWDTATQLADAVCTFVTAHPSLANKVLILPSDNAPSIPCISSLNMVTGQSFAYGDVLGDARPRAPRSLADACTRARLCAMYAQTLTTPTSPAALSTDALCERLKGMIAAGFAAGATPPEDVLCTDFGCVQAITHMLSTPAGLDVPPVADAGAAAFTCSAGNTEFPTVVAVGAPANSPAVSVYYYGARGSAADAAKVVSLCSQGPSFVDVYQALYGGPARLAAAGPLPAGEYVVYGRYTMAPRCHYTVAAVECLLKNGQKVQVVEVPNAADAAVPATKPAAHVTVPVVFKKCGGTNTEYIGGCAEVKAAFPTP